MPLVSIREILFAARDGGYAVPAFDVMDPVSADAVFAAAHGTGMPMIVMVPDSGLRRMNLDRLLRYLATCAREAVVPVALQLDHGKDLEMVMKCIHAGFSSVMIDGSELDDEQNIALTRKVTEIAHAAGVAVEGEIGHVSGGGGALEPGFADERRYTGPDAAARFVEQTGVDALAIAIGTTHGVYKGTPRLDFHRLAEIRSAVSVPLVLHGGSGLSEEDFCRLIRGGISKINIFTELSMRAVEQSLGQAKKMEGKLHFAALVQAGGLAVQQVAGDYLRRFHMVKGE